MVVGELGLGHLLPPPPSAVRPPAAAAWRDWGLVVRGRPVAEWLLPPPALARRLAAAVLAHFLLPQQTVRRPMAAAWQDRHQVRTGRVVVDLLPPPLPSVRRPVAAARGVLGTALVRRQLQVVGLSASPVTVELAAAADLVQAAVVPSVAMATTLGRASWARVPPPPRHCACRLAARRHFWACSGRAGGDAE